MHFNCAGSHKVWSPVWAPILVRRILRVNYCIKSFLCNVQVHFNCAGSHKSLQHFTCKFSHRGASCAMSKCISTAQPRAKCGSRSWSPAFFLSILAQMVLVKCPNAFRLRRLAQRVVPAVVPDLGPQHFKFLHKKLLAQCPSGFRVCRLAQSVDRDRGPRHFSW